MASFGEELKRERELRDISLKEIAESTNIPIRFLEALEQNDFSVLPGGAYTRGFVRSYAKHIGVNIEEMVDSYQQELNQQEAAHQKQPGRGPSERSTRTRSGPVGLLVGACIVLATCVIGVVYWVGRRSEPAPPPSDTSPHIAALKAKVKKSGAIPQPPADGAASPSQAPVEGRAAPSSASAGVIEPDLVGVDRLVRIRALETTWVKLTCAGETQFEGDLWVGSERHFPCREPMLLSAGNGGAVQCSVDSSGLQFLGERGQTVLDRPLPLEPPPADPNAPAKMRPGQAVPATTPNRGQGLQTAGAES